jgi:hypothetical protein
LKITPVADAMDGMMSMTTTLKRYRLIEAGNHYDTVEAESADVALEVALANVDPCAYGLATSTRWIDVLAVAEHDASDSASMRIALDPVEPDCEGQEHDWCSPFSVVGGVAENPGMWGHSGGLIIREACANCGHYRVTEARDMLTGDQERTIKYEDADEKSLLWLKRESRVTRRIRPPNGS